MKSAVYLLKAKEGPMRRGHPWIFPKAIKKSQGQLVTGELLSILSEAGELLGVGVYNEHSLYRVRVLALGFEGMQEDSIEEIITKRLHQAKVLRDSIGLPNNETNAYRLFNSEADGLSGLTIDRFNTIAVVSSTAFWIEARKNWIVEQVRQIFALEDVVWQSQEKTLVQDGWKEFNVQKNHSVLEILEAGIRFEVDLASKQKTGLFLDQRENHQRIAALAKSKQVLDLYCYSGGFGMHAAKAGASSVTAVDSSAQAIALAKKNAQLNDLDNIHFIEADAREYLAMAKDFDLVILDPPKLVPSQRHLQKAKNYYRFLHREVFKVMKSGSILMSCNCSSALSAEQFTDLLSQQALACNKLIRILGVFGPASCHPVLASFPEGQYLTAVLLAIV